MNRSSQKTDGKSRISYSIQCGTQTDLTYCPGYFSQDHVAIPRDLFESMARVYYSKRPQFRSISTMTDGQKSMIFRMFLSTISFIDVIDLIDSITQTDFDSSDALSNISSGDELRENPIDSNKKSIEKKNSNHPVLSIKSKYIINFDRFIYIYR